MTYNEAPLGLLARPGWDRAKMFAAAHTVADLLDLERAYSPSWEDWIGVAGEGIRAERAAAYEVARATLTAADLTMYLASYEYAPDVALAAVRAFEERQSAQEG